MHLGSRYLIHLTNDVQLVGTVPVAISLMPEVLIGTPPEGAAVGAGEGAIEGFVAFVAFE